MGEENVDNAASEAPTNSNNIWVKKEKTAPRKSIFISLYIAKGNRKEVPPFTET